MEIRQLRYLVAVVDEGGFTRAAKRVHVAQPGVSTQVRQLERELGQDLVDRSGRTVRLTSAGAALLPLIRKALTAVEELRHVADELSGLVRGHVRVGMVTSCGAFEVPDLLAGFHQSHPGVELTLSEASSDDLVAALRDGTLDVGLIALDMTDPDGLDLRVVADEPLVAAVAHDHPLAARRVIPLAELVEHPLISMPPGSGIRGMLDEACAAAELAPRIGLEATNPQMLARLAARGLGVSIVPSSTVAQNADLHGLIITQPRLRGRLALAWRSGAATSTAARALVDRARSHLNETVR